MSNNFNRDNMNGKDLSLMFANIDKLVSGEVTEQMRDLTRTIDNAVYAVVKEFQDETGELPGAVTVKTEVDNNSYHVRVGANIFPTEAEAQGYIDIMKTVAPRAIISMIHGEEVEIFMDLMATNENKENDEQL